jgi:hypothetical protein
LSEKESDNESGPELEWRDYVAITIAALETVMLPLVVLVILMIVIFLVIR